MQRRTVMTEHVRIFDTTLRDGEQAAKINLSKDEKLRIARQLARLGADIIEAGFPAGSVSDFESVKAISKEIEGPVIAALARTCEEDITKAALALKDAARPRIHTYIATSPIHMEYKLKMDKEKVLSEVRNAVTLARTFVEDVEFSAEDASRSDADFLVEVFKTAIECGASTVNVPDTVGYAQPEEFFKFLKDIMERTNAPSHVLWSVHCHNDLGLAVANSLAAVRAGVRQVECTINGLGERAGNAAMEEIVMAINTRADYYNLHTKIETSKFYSTSKLVSQATGVMVQPNKAIVGRNAFTHEALIHRHGMLCNRATYEIMTPETVGTPLAERALGKHSGRHMFREKTEDMGYQLSAAETDYAFTCFKELCEKKKDVSDGDIEAMILDKVLSYTPEKMYKLKDFAVQIGTGCKPTASVTLSVNSNDFTEAAVGNGPVDAVYNAIKKILGISPQLKGFRIGATSERSDAQAETRIILHHKEIQAQGRGTSTDIVESSVRAYVDAVNRLYTAAAAKDVKL